MKDFSTFIAEATHDHGEHKQHTAATLQTAISRYHGHKPGNPHTPGDRITKVKYMGQVKRAENVGNQPPHHKYEATHADGGKDIVHASHDGKTADYVSE